MDNKTINREAADKTKGFRLQKIRAIKLMLDSLSTNKNSIFYTAIEVIEDISHTTESSDLSEQYVEEDKNYDPNNNFTIFSSEVKNTLVSFFDIYINTWRASEEINLGFYTTSGIGKERKSKLDNGTNVNLPKEPILAILMRNDPISIELIETIKSIILEEYKKQYQDKKVDGHVETLKAIKPDDFKTFLDKVKWNFGEENEVNLKTTVLSLIRNSEFYNSRIANKEEIIFSLLMELIDERQNNLSYAGRFVHSSDVKLVFKEAESEEIDHATDPTWNSIEALEKEITDKRNLSEKIRAVCPDYPERKLGHLARLASRSKIEQLAGNKSFLSLKYRTYEACNQYLFDNDFPEPDSTAEVDSTIKGLNEASSKHIEELKKDYNYSISNKNTIDGVVMDLIDSCFVSFDEK
jgi:hypothetical protein